MLSSRLHTVLTGRPVFHAASASAIWMRDILAPAKCAADGRIAYDDLLRIHAQRMRDLFPLLMHPLPATDHLDSPIRAYECLTRLRLQIGVLLCMGAIDTLDDDVRLGKGRVHITVHDVDRV